MIEIVINNIKKGKLVALTDSDGNTFLTYPAKLITSEIFKQMLHYSNHLVGLALSPDKNILNLSTAINSNKRFTEPYSLLSENYGLPILSAIHTINSLTDKDGSNQQYSQKGLIYPVLTKVGTSLVLPDIPEVAFDLVALAGFDNGAVYCALHNENGDKLNKQEVNQIIKNLEIELIEFDEVIRHRLQFEPLVELTISVKLPTDYGDFQLHVYKNRFDKNNNVNLALTIGDMNSEKIPLVRVHSEWSISNIVNRFSIEKESYLNLAMRRIAEHGKGALVLLYNTPDKAMDLSIYSDEKIQADIWLENGEIKILQAYQNSMSLGLGAQIIHDLGITKMNLLTNTEKLFDSIAHYGLEILKRVKF